MAQPFKILIVNDEPDIVRYLEHVLHRLGYETVTAGDGAQAIERAAADPPDLILLEVMMPVMDGFAVCRRLREREATRLIPVIVMTALTGIENRVKLLEHGPVDERELVARVQGALARKRELDHRLGDLARVRDHFAKFVPEAVRRLVLANPDAPGLDKHERDVTVLFVDISG
jgi:DNA-binding response OmpR family regulator